MTTHSHAYLRDELLITENPKRDRVHFTDYTLFNYVNVQSEDDIVLREELEAMQKAHPKEFHLYLTVSHASDSIHFFLLVHSFQTLQ